MFPLLSFNILVLVDIELLVNSIRYKLSNEMLTPNVELLKSALII